MSIDLQAARNRNRPPELHGRLLRIIEDVEALLYTADGSGGWYAKRLQNTLPLVLETLEGLE